MPTEKPPERGVRSPYQARYGITIGDCQGLDLKHDSSTLDDEALIDATNVRVHDGIVLSRFGQTSLNSASPLNGCVQGLIGVQGSGPRLVLAMVRPGGGPPPPSASLSNRSDIDLFDNGVTPNYVRVTNPPNNRLSAQPRDGQLQGSGTTDDTKSRYAYFWWNDQIIFGGYDDAGEDKLYRFLFPDENLSIDTVQIDELFRLRVPGEVSDFQIASMCSLPELATQGSSSASNSPKLGPPLYFGTVGGGVVAYVNGELVRLLAEATFTSRVIVFEYHNRLYASGRQDLQVQNGWAGGGSAVSTSFSTVTMPVGVTDMLSMAAIEYGGLGFIVGADLGALAPQGRILQLNDSTGSPVLTVANNGNPGTDNVECFDDIAEGLGSIFVGFRCIPSVTPLAYVAEFTTSGGATTTVAGPWSEDGQVIRLVGTREGLYISAWGTNAYSGGSAPAIFRYDGTSTTVLADVVDAGNIEVAPFDMVAF